MTGMTVREQRLSVVVPTRNRPDQVVDCVASVLANDVADFELIVVDQSDGHETERELAREPQDGRVRYIRSSERGASAARNTGAAKSRGDIVVFTDDDCRVAPNWISRVLDVFRDDPEAAVMFGRVVVPEGTFVHGYAASFEPTVRAYHRRLPYLGVGWGLGANMAFRRTALDTIGPFDPVLGPGGLLRAAGEDVDIEVRALRAGLKVVNAREVEVLHLGVRTGKDVTQLVRSYNVGTGAALFKHVRLGDLHLLRFYVHWVAHYGVEALRNLVTGRRPSGLGSSLDFLLGSLRCLRYGIDRTDRVFIRPRSTREPA